MFAQRVQCECLYPGSAGKVVYFSTVEQFLFLRPKLTVPPLESPSEQTRVFISYRSQDPDKSLAEDFYEALKAAGNQPFMAAKSIRLGENWPQRIDEELERADYFVLLLSEKSVVSEMVTEEVRRARELRDRNPNGKPAILPIRVCFPINSPVALNYDLRGYLQRTQQREWNSPADTPVILQEMLELLSQNGRGESSFTPVESTESTEELETAAPAAESLDRPPLPVAEPELPEGQVDLASAFYMERPPIESRCYEAIAKPGALIRIKAPRPHWQK